MQTDFIGDFLIESDNHRIEVDSQKPRSFHSRLSTSEERKRTTIMKSFTLIFLIIVVIDRCYVDGSCIDLEAPDCCPADVADLHLKLSTSFIDFVTKIGELVKYIAELCKFYVEIRELGCTFYEAVIRFILHQPGQKCTDWGNAVQTFSNSWCKTFDRLKIYFNKCSDDILRVVVRDYVFGLIAKLKRETNAIISKFCQVSSKG